ncbi:MAG: ECF transporter S component [Lachnospiraceae bacterium]|nr:ECF transporter S component [Lachnospiraceae bacterium]
MNKTAKTKKTERLYGILIGITITIIAVIGCIITFSHKAEDVITANDTGFIYSLIFAILGIAATITNTILYFNNEIPSLSQSDRIKKLTQAALLTALCYIGFQYFRFDIPVGTEKTAIHFGNTFCVLAALLLGGTWGGLAGAVGMTIADLTSSYVTSAPKTFLLKLGIGLIVGFVAHTVFHLNEEHSKTKILRITVIASVCGMAFNVVADPIVGYFYKKYLFGIEQDMAAILAKISAATTLVNAATSVVLAVLLYTALRPALMSANLFLPAGQKQK